MWTPTSEQDILSAVDAGDLIETATFDAKASLPTKDKSKDLAIDVAAMATDSGSLLYGLGEDESRVSASLQAVLGRTLRTPRSIAEIPS